MSGEGVAQRAVFCNQAREPASATRNQWNRIIEASDHGNWRPRSSSIELWTGRLRPRRRHNKDVIGSRAGDQRRNSVAEATSELRRLKLSTQRVQQEGNVATSQEWSNPESQDESANNFPVKDSAEEPEICCDHPDSYRRPLGSVEIVPERVPELCEHSASTPCQVSCVQNGKTWERKGKVVRAVTGGNGELNVWQLGDTTSAKSGLVFGYFDSEWHYVSAPSQRRPLTFDSNGGDPSEISLNSKDSRVFIQRRDVRSGTAGVILESAIFPNTAVDIGNNGKLVLSRNKGDLPSWNIR